VEDVPIALKSNVNNNDIRWRCVGWVDLCDRKNVNAKSAYYILIGSKRTKNQQPTRSSVAGDKDAAEQLVNTNEDNEESDDSSSSSMENSRMVLRRSRECEEVLKAAAHMEREALLNGSFKDSIGTYEDSLIGGNGGGNGPMNDQHTSIGGGGEEDIEVEIDDEEEEEGRGRSTSYGGGSSSGGGSSDVHGSRLSNREKMRRKIDHALKRFGKVT
jgi:hypothetical protein